MPVIFTQVETKNSPAPNSSPTSRISRRTRISSAVKTKLHAYALVLDAIQEYLEAESLRLASKNGHPSNKETAMAVGEET